MGSSWLRSAFTCQPPRTADSRLWDGGPQPGAENHQGWRAHVVSSRRANQYVSTGFRSVPKRSLPGRSMRMRGCPAGDVSEGVVEPLDHQFGHPAIVTWVEADPPATVEVIGGGDDRRANGDR